MEFLVVKRDENEAVTIFSWKSVMELFAKIRRNLFAIFQVALIVVLIAFATGFVVVMLSEQPEWIFRFLGVTERAEPKYEALKFLGIGMGGVLVALQALMAYKRAKALENTAKAQADTVLKTEEGQRQDRLKNAIEHLGHGSESVRLGGAYELFHLAEDTKKLRQTVLDILCAHIRQTTAEKQQYRETHQWKPSEEVQSLLTLLFVQEHEVFSGLRVNLQGGWLNGANLAEARLPKAILAKANLQEACLCNAQLVGSDLAEAQLQKADLTGANLQKVSFVESHMQRANLSNAKLQGSILNDARLHGAILVGAHLQETGLNGTYLQAANLSMARMQMASLGGAKMQGAYLAKAQLHGAILRDAQMQGTYLRSAQLHEARFSSIQGLQNYNETSKQGIDPEPAQLQGVSSSKNISSSRIIDLISEQVNQESDLTGATFAGGLSEDDIASITEDLSDERATELREKLKIHLGKPESQKLPEDSGAVTGTYTKAEAEMWIFMYKEAVRGFSGDDS